MIFWSGFAVGFIAALALVVFAMWYSVRMINRKGKAK